MEEQIIKNAYYGSDLKLKITVDFLGNDPNTDFDVIITVGTKQAVINKSKLIKIDDKTYFACIKAPYTMRGKGSVSVKAYFADADFEDNIHTVVRPAESNFKVI